MKKINKLFLVILVLMAAFIIAPTSTEAATKLNKTKATITAGQTVQLKVKGKKAKKWTSSNKAVATVNSKGKVTGVGAGTATIKVKVKGGKTLKCVVTVTVPDPKIWTNTDVYLLRNYLETAQTYVQKAKDNCKYQSLYNLYISYAKPYLVAAYTLASSKYAVTTQDGTQLAVLIQGACNSFSKCESFKSSEYIAGRIFYNVPLAATAMLADIAKAKLQVSYLVLNGVLPAPIQ